MHYSGLASLPVAFVASELKTFLLEAFPPALWHLHLFREDCRADIELVASADTRGGHLHGCSARVSELRVDSQENTSLFFF